MKMVSQDSKKNLPPAAQASADANTENYKIAIRRVGHLVEIKLVFSSEYGSMEFYDSLAQSVNTGSLQFELKFAKPKV
jgi:hypothetical protein